MPIYEYQCASCLHKFELMQKIHDDPVKKCPICFEDQAQRLVSAAGFQLKGTGWYVTDFKNKDKPEKKADKKDATQEKSGEKSSDKPSSAENTSKKKGETD
ncbi:FmdB family zinc ribbon protein [Legionella londiniensis]|uniref:Zinc ribbon domain protein n=1 Tax=Legionella londiniensis TaxID=45068 RepID=A0A0W0VKN5_9GAMM|nr:zinc ribbon domain-containing protein [Legionella londiniensis]KTD20676.1 Zinc ribbon domain protein [Legionella londiniensis]STX92852.1 Type I antifreeze protein [Legionella londiniensis]